MCSRYDSDHIYSMIMDYDSITIQITDLMLKSWCTFIVRTADDDSVFISQYLIGDKQRKSSCTQARVQSPKSTTRKEVVNVHKTRSK